MNARYLAFAFAASTIAACSAAPSEGVGSNAAPVTAAQCDAAQPWAENVSYAVGELVSYSGAVYQCVQAHTSEAGWTPSAVPALWSPTSCSGGGGGSTSSGGGGSSSGGSTSSGSSSGASSGGGSTSSCSGWIYMATATSCNGHLGESCGWTAANEGQGYHCTNMGSWVGCEPGGGGACGGTSSGGSTGGTSSGGSSSGGSTGGTSSGGSTGGTSSGGASGGLGGILTESMFDSMFPNRNAIYTYAALVQAAGTYSAFATTGGADGSKREVAAFLANVAHETGALVYVDEIAQAQYCSPTAACPCAAGAEYFGRGSLQLSWNFNYCAAGAALGEPLQANPDLISTDSRLAWLTGVWFWMTSTGAGSQTPHDAINSTGFGGTIQAINGSIECNGGDPSEVQDRVQYYTTFCAMLGVDPGSNTGC